MSETEKLARLLADSVTRAIANGIEHRDQSGRLLTTPQEVIEALLRDEPVWAKEPR